MVREGKFWFTVKMRRFVEFKRGSARTKIRPSVLICLAMDNDTSVQLSPSIPYLAEQS